MQQEDHSQYTPYNNCIFRGPIIPVSTVFHNQGVKKKAVRALGHFCNL